MTIVAPFYEYHPSSEIGVRLFLERNLYIEKLISQPKSALESLVKIFGFGKFSDFWDDYIFNLVVSPALHHIIQLDLEVAIDTYSIIDHSLFLLYIRRDEDPIRFRRAFWNLNQFGLALSKRFFSPHSNYINFNNSDTTGLKTIAFLFKGPFSLAHSEFFLQFLKGCRYFSNYVSVHLILIDIPRNSFAQSGLDHISIHSLIDLPNPSSFKRLTAYLKLVERYRFDHISWIASVQNLSLYMGSQLAPTQSYWSMKYHSIIMPTLQKYAGLGFGGTSFLFDDKSWFRGRAFPDLTLPNLTTQDCKDIRSKFSIPYNAFVVGCFVRSEKLSNLDFWELISSLLKQHDNVHFVLAAQSLPVFSNHFLKLDHFLGRFHHVGWIDTKRFCQCIDLYLDSFPRGSCLTILEAIKANVPTLMFDSPHNRESSALPYLLAVSNNRTPPGVLDIESPNLISTRITPYILSGESRFSLATSQKNLLSKLEGRSILFAKDYLNYFMNSNLSIHRV